MPLDAAGAELVTHYDRQNEYRRSDAEFLDALRAVLRLEPLYPREVRAAKVDHSLWTDEAFAKQYGPRKRSTTRPKHWARDEWEFTYGERRRPK